MSSHFIPMLSSSPPPIDDNDSPENDEEDDAFGMFTSANLDFDGSFDSSTAGENAESPMKTDKKFVKCDNQINCSSENKDKPVFPTDKISEQKIKLDHNDIRSETFKEQGAKIDNCSTLDEHSSNKKFINDYNSFDRGEASPQNNHKHISSQKHLLLSTCNETSSELSSEANDPHFTTNSKTQNSSESDIPDRISAPNHYDFNKCLNDENHTYDSSSFETVNTNPINTKSVSLEVKEVHNDETVEHFNNSEINGICSVMPDDNDDGDNYDTNLDTSICEKTLNLPVVDDDQELIARTDPPDKCSSLSSRSSDNEFEDFKFATDDNEISGTASMAEKGLNVISTDHSSNNADDDDDFGDFESVSVPSFNAFSDAPIASAVCQSDESNFADFGTSKIVNSNSWKACDDDFQSADIEDFADFEEASNKVEFQTIPQLTSISKEATGSFDKISKLIDTVFPVSDAIESSEDNETTFDILEQNSKSRRLWDKLHDTNKTPGIPFQWGVSHSFQQLLRSVNVDYHSIDPIPPVNFDWGSSGLVNPLDSNQNISALMDLTFLTSTDETPSSRGTSEIFSLENELLKPDLDIPCNKSVKKAPILEQILSLSANTSAISSDSVPGFRPPNLSQEAAHVLDQLPDISFIRAKVLMFPVSSNT